MASTELKERARATWSAGDYGFSFQYPATWERQDPVNGDGLAAIGTKADSSSSATALIRRSGPARPTPSPGSTTWSGN
jgi:hypothetical protein